MPVDPIVTKRFIEALSTQLEDHLASWKSSLADAKRDIESTLNAMSERIPAHAKPLFPEDLMGMILEDVLPPPVEKIVERIVEKVVEVEKLVSVAGPAAAAPPDWSVVRSSMASIEAARTQVDVLTRFLTQAHAHASRVALLVLRNDRLTGWKALGFDGSGGRDEAVKSIDIAANEDPFASEALSRERSILAEPADESGPLRRALGGRPPARTFLVPMVIRDRIAGVLCADELPGDEGRLNHAALESLTFVTGLCVDLLAARKRIPSPTLTPLGEPLTRFGRPVPEVLGDEGTPMRAMPAIDLPPPPAAVPAQAPGAPPRAEAPDSQSRRRITDANEALRALEESAAAHHKPEPEPVRHVEPPHPVEQPRPVEPPRAVEPPPRPEPPRPAPRPVPSMEDLGLTTAIPVPSVAPHVPVRESSAPRPVPSPPPLAGGELTMAFDQMKGAGAAPAPAVLVPPRESSAPRPMPVPAPAGGAEPIAAGSGALPMAPPAGFVPRGKARGDDQSRAIEDARRLARLLVSEIKLYNEKKVEEGRKHLDLYQRLKDDIDRSRQVFAERTPEAIRKGNDFFHEELVRILADGRSEALGLAG